MKLVRVLSLFALLLCSMLFVRPSHAQSQMVCENSPIPAGWVVTGVNSQTNNPCSPNRQLTIYQLPASVDSVNAVCGNSALPSDWVWVSVYAYSQCAPYQASNIRRANFASGSMCDLSAVPVGYVVTAVFTGNTCAPARQFTLKQIPAGTFTESGVCANSPTPDGWVYTAVLNGGVSCQPFQLGNIARADYANGAMCANSPVPAGYLVVGIQNSTMCGQYKQYLIKKA
jgi:hypothetical protein